MKKINYLIVETDAVITLSSRWVFKKRVMSNEKNIPAKQAVEGKKTWLQEKNVHKKRQKDNK